MAASANSSPHTVSGTLAGSAPPVSISNLIYSLKSCFSDSDFKHVATIMENLRKEKEEIEAKYRSVVEKYDQMELEKLGLEDKCRKYEREIHIMMEKLEKLKEQNSRLEHEVSASEGKAEEIYKKWKTDVEDSEENKREKIAELLGKNRALETEKRSIETEFAKLVKMNEVLGMEKEKIEDEWRMKLKDKQQEIVELTKEKRELEDELRARVLKLEQDVKPFLPFLGIEEGDPGIDGFGSDYPVCKNGATQGLAAPPSEIIKIEQNTTLDLGGTPKKQSSTPKEPRRRRLDNDIKDSSGQGAALVQKVEPVEYSQKHGPVKVALKFGSVGVIDIDSDDDAAAPLSHAAPLAQGNKSKQPTETIFENVILSENADDDDRHTGKRRRKECKDLPCKPSVDPPSCHQPVGCHGSLDDRDDEDPVKSQSAQKLIASLRRSREEKIWECKEDMDYAFKMDSELCLKAVCALYRYVKSVGKSKFHLVLSGDRDQNERDIKRIFGLAEFLIDGDPGGKMRKSVGDLQQQGLQDCRKLAADYSRKLFNIYKSKKDPFFCHGAL